ncbi:MAG: hypothetical protein OZSIB_2038 [Candidatus Ozemobacter sibiricus]|jgi:hypothetical protein|uniref:Uncharacterized protein n=1 Tax=Candidatus Ozemobacter sibiricus TaxID=2268124 RepID=A0A367ZJH1_9BACT|nr:MAG: hypothetical protein OZSIB_2038 [Candidatus Ozemobacter sibiricus]
MNGTRRGITLVEALIGAILLLLLFYAAFRTLLMARQEALKGLWLQEQIIALRNTTRALGQAIKASSYPSTIAREGGEEVVFSYKEARSFDGSGRLRQLDVKGETDLDMKLVSGFISPSAVPQRVMVFPICTPELDAGNHTPGRIVWNELVLEPDPAYFPLAGLGRLKWIERETTYSSQGLASRAFSLNLTFPANQPPTREKVLISSVDGLFISYFSVDELRGIAVTTKGEINRKLRRRFLVSVRIDCSHFRDERMRIGDQCSVVNNIDISELVGGGMTLVVLAVTGNQAKVRFNGSETMVGVGSVLGGRLKVTRVKAGSGSEPGFIEVSIDGSSRTQVFLEQK